MTIAIKKKPKPEVAVAKPVNVLYGTDDLTADLAKAAALQDTMALLRDQKKQIEAQMAIEATKHSEITARLLKELVPADAAHDWSKTAVMHSFSVTVGKAPMTRAVVNKQKAGDYMGEEVFWEIVNLPLKAIDDYLSPPQRDEVLQTTFHEDRRPVTVKSTKLSKAK